MYVGISHDLKSRIRNRIEGMIRQEKALYGNEPDVKMEGTEDWFERITWGEHLHLRDVIPDEWMVKSPGARFRFDVEDDGRTFMVTIDTEYPETRLPPESPRRPEFRYNQDILTEDVDLRVAFGPVVQWHLDMHICDRKWQGVRSHVMTFLDRCRSLNEAVKLWPDIRAYVPAEILVKLDEKKAKADKRNAAEILAGIDTDALTTAAVAAKLAGGGLTTE